MKKTVFIDQIPSPCFMSADYMARKLEAQEIARKCKDTWDINTAP